ncbi:MAG: short-chain dehydrogenase, partial [Candidatus Hydrogenedentes bacterium]|nr:short-chain dehydrogenase [Candidatus Hydrogenedentota bacterium]
MATPENGPQTVMILGATSAMARATAAEFARAGYQLILGARNQEENQIIAA